MGERNGTPVEVRDFLDWLVVERGRSSNTVAAYRRDLEQYATWLSGRKRTLSTCGVGDIEAFLAARIASGAAKSSMARQFSAIRMLHRYMVEERVRDDDPSAMAEGVSKPAGIPKPLTEEETERVIGSVVGDEPRALRDRALLGLMYACGLRASEAATLGVRDYNPTLGVVLVRGKGNKQRIVYLNDATKKALDDWLIVRKTIVPEYEPALFVTNRRARISREMIHSMVKKNLLAAGLDPTQYSSHKLRHTAATLMLQNGVDVRTLQEVLGHEHLNTTQIYTHVDNAELRTAARANPLAEFEPDRGDHDGKD